MLKNDLEAHDDVLYVQNELDNVREDDDVKWDRSKIPGILIDTNITDHNCTTS